MADLILFNKPNGVLSQFTDQSGRPTLSEFIPVKNVYPCGRLDRDSEGLLLLTEDGKLQHRISDPSRKMNKTYLVQVEGEITEDALEQLRRGVSLKDGPASAVKAVKINEPDLWPRDPPIRERKSIPTSWAQITLSEGRNRQVRRMTAAVDFPTLRLVRTAIGPWSLDNLASGSYCTQEIDPGKI